MALKKITQITGRGVAVLGDDIDTDRIIPARYMKCVTFDGLGEYMFYDMRFDEGGNKKDHPLNDPAFDGATVLISGNNFGCGSSREHAPQAIYRYGFRAIIAEGFAEIFFGNSTALGMPCLTVSHEARLALTQIVNEDPGCEIHVDLKKKEIRCGENAFPCEIRDSAHGALLSGHWDPIADLLEAESDIAKTASKLDYMKT